MRVITGKYKGRHFDVPRNFKARPTTDFAKENLFNVLRAYVDFEDTRVLDLFCGTGSITLEFLSRGCPRVVSVEKDRAHFSFIAQTLRTLGDPAAQPLCGDALKYVARSNEGFDLVFADPPYALTRLAELPDLILNKGMIAEGGMLILEHGKDNSFAEHPCFVQERVYGSVHFSFFEPRKEEE